MMSRAKEGGRGVEKRAFQAIKRAKVILFDIGGFGARKKVNFLLFYREGQFSFFLNNIYFKGYCGPKRSLFNRSSNKSKGEYNKEGDKV